MHDTTWPGAPAAANPAFGVRITVDDYGKLLDMILHDGLSNGTRVLSKDAVTQIVTDQVSDYETSHDYSVGITGIPRYGLGSGPTWWTIRQDRGRERERRERPLPLGRLHDAHLGRRRGTRRTRRAVRGAGVAEGRGGGAHRRRSLTPSV